LIRLSVIAGNLIVTNPKLDLGEFVIQWKLYTVYTELTANRWYCFPSVQLSRAVFDGEVRGVWPPRKR